MRDMTDGELGRIVAVGSVIGIAAVFIVVVAICLIAGLTIGQAAGVASVPTLFGGWFYGGLVLVLRASYREERAVRTPAAGAPPAEAPAGVSRRAA